MHCQHDYQRTHDRRQPDQHAQEDRESRNRALDCSEQFPRRLNLVTGKCFVDPLGDQKLFARVFNLHINQGAFVRRLELVL